MGPALTNKAGTEAGVQLLEPNLMLGVYRQRNMKSVGTGKKGKKNQPKVQSRDHPALQPHSHDSRCPKQGKMVLLICSSQTQKQNKTK